MPAPQRSDIALQDGTSKHTHASNRHRGGEGQTTCTKETGESFFIKKSALGCVVGFDVSLLVDLVEK